MSLRAAALLLLFTNDPESADVDALRKYMDSIGKPSMQRILSARLCVFQMAKQPRDESVTTALNETKQQLRNVGLTALSCKSRPLKLLMPCLTSVFGKAHVPLWCATDKRVYADMVNDMELPVGGNNAR